MIQQYWSDKAKSLTPYTAGEQPKEKLVKLNTNENAYPPSPKVAQAIAREVPNLRLYPSPDADILREAIAQSCGLSPSQVFCANGSDEALAFCFSAFFQNKTADAENWFPGTEKRYSLRTADITYSFYPVWSDFFDIALETVPLREDFTINIDSLLKSRGVVIANPNAPTGICLTQNDIRRIASETDGVVLIDEAYIAFGGESAIPLLRDYDNLAIVRTFSKSHSLAGLRVGYVLAQESLIDALRTVKDSFNSYPVDRLAQAGAAAAILDREYTEKIITEIITTRESTKKQLQDMGISCLPSGANFLFVHCGKNAAHIFRALREKGVLVRYFNQPRIREYLRVTIGTPEEMAVFLSAMKEIL